MADGFLLESQTMKPITWRFLMSALLLGGLFLAGMGFRKTVTLQIDQETQRHTTFALNVGGFLNYLEISLGPEDRLSPPPNHWLKEGELVKIERAARVEIMADGQLHDLLTAERLPARLLEQVSITLQPEDILISNAQPIAKDDLLPPAQNHSLQVLRARAIHLTEGSQKSTFLTAAPTLGQALWEAGVDLYAEDLLNPPADTPLLSETGTTALEMLEVDLQLSRLVTIQVNGKDLGVRTAAGMVGEVLALANLPLQGLDYSLPPEEEPVPVDGAIRIVRVREEVQIEHSPLPFETEYQPDAELELDKQSIIQTGEYGLTARRLRIRYEDGEESSRYVEGEWIARQPQNRIVGYGTQIVMHTADTPDGPVQYWRALQMWATSYHPAVTSNTTASGLPLAKGVAAVDRRYIPFYTRLYIPGYGEAVAADIGGGVRGRWIDLGYSDADYEPWHQWVTVYFLWPPPENIVWIIP